MDEGFLNREDLDGAASVIANRIEDGSDEIISELIRKGILKGSDMVQGGQKEVRSHILRAMAEACEAKVGKMIVESMSASQKALHKTLATETYHAIRGVLSREGIDPMEADSIMGRVNHHLRSVTEKIAMRSRRRSRA
jgi:hypothetical protein